MILQSMVAPTESSYSQVSLIRLKVLGVAGSAVGKMPGDTRQNRSYEGHRDAS